MGHSYTIVNGVLINYYEVLKVERTVTSEAIKKAYYLQAKIWHPDRNPEKKAETEKQFKLIGEAYEILSNHYHRSQYDIDLQNYERISNSKRSSFTSKTEARFSSSSQRSTSGTSNFTKTEFNSTSETPKPAPFNKNSKNPPRNSQPSSNGTSNPPKPKPTKPSKVTHKLQVSLEELYIGTQKKVRITRSFLSGMQTQDVLVFDITPGWCENRKIELKSKGDEYAPRTFQDITFELVPKPHTKFKLIGEELELEVKLSIVESLCGFTRDLPHFAGQVVSYTTPKCTGQGYVTRIPEGGMPYSDNPAKFRDLILRFSVQLPEELTPFQVQAIQSLF